MGCFFKYCYIIQFVKKMREIFSLTIITTCCFLVACKTGADRNIPKITADTKMLDSIKLKADTTYSKRYPGATFATATYFINDSSKTQVMLDSNQVIRQVIIEQNKRRKYFAQFYANGQLMAKYGLDSFGQYDGFSSEYYENGNLKAAGIYKSGFRSGEWKNYDKDGKYISMDEYDKNGQRTTR